jgi:hypothetical protein
MRIPHRRNKNIGTRKSGYRRQSKFGVPTTPAITFYEHLKDSVKIHRYLKESRLDFYIEPPAGGRIYHCTPDDVVRVLSEITNSSLKDFKTIVFRNSSAKQETLVPAWGRMKYGSSLSRTTGPVVFIESQKPDLKMKFSRKLNSFYFNEIKKLENEGHDIEFTKRHVIIHCNSAAIRSTQLYRTLFHEIGHYNDYYQQVELPNLYQDEYESWGRLYDNYFNKPTREREEAAERFAGLVKSQLMEQKIIPFASTSFAGSDISSELNLDWFYWGDA